jgi:hypothetical protein
VAGGGSSSDEQLGVVDAGAAERVSRSLCRRAKSLSINHMGQFPAVTISFNLNTGYSLGEALDAINKVIKKDNLPTSVVSNYQGTAAAFEGSLSNEGLLILAALVTVYIVLGVLYESFVHPVTILSTLPSAGVGALLALELFHLDLDIVAIIGIILLIGIVKKNGIMMVDFALEAERHHGLNATEAIYQASLLRFRPIHDDDDVRAAERHSAGVWKRHWIGAAQAAGRGDGGRTAVQPGADAVHDAGDLYLLRQPGRDGLRGAASKPDAWRARRPMEPRGGTGMNPSRVFIERPVATTLLTIAVAIAGMIAFGVLPVSPLPQVDFPTISVGASLPGASPDIMASSVATPLERQFAHIAGVTEMTSSSSLGTTSVTLQFDLNRDINGAARDVEAGINAARTYLPANLPQNPTYRKVNPADSPIMVIGLQSDVYDVPAMYDEASTVIEQRISQIRAWGRCGGGSVAAGGAGGAESDAAEQLWDWAAGGAAGDRGTERGYCEGAVSNGNVTADILTNDQISKAALYKPLVVGYHNGGAVRLQDVADVIDSQQSVRQAGYLNGKPSVTDYFPAAGRQHYYDGGCDQGGDAFAAGRRFRRASTSSRFWTGR